MKKQINVSSIYVVGLQILSVLSERRRFLIHTRDILRLGANTFYGFFQLP